MPFSEDRKQDQHRELFEREGLILADKLRLPYVPLFFADPSPMALRQLPGVLAARWGVFPVEFLPQFQLLTLAISKEEQIPLLCRRFRFLLTPFVLAFTAATPTEIRRALIRHHPPEAGASSPASSQESVS